MKCKGVYINEDCDNPATWNVTWRCKCDPASIIAYCDDCQKIAEDFRVLFEAVILCNGCQGEVTHVVWTKIETEQADVGS